MQQLDRPNEPPAEALKSGFGMLNGQSILVTGGSGSFGRRFVETVLRHASPRRVIVFSRDEFKQYEMQQQLGPEWASTLRFFIGDVRDRERLELAMREVDVCVHAAALKHVPAAEYNPMECIHTNVYGAENVVRAALNTGVKRVIALSTDKAANPVNLYGASKLASDKIFIAANNLSGSLGTRFSVVRYGNVVGSRGSVIPLFRRMIAEGAEALPVTDERMTRFWITLQHGVDFVVSCIAMMQGGEIFVPKIPSMRITDLAHAMAPHLPHRLVGIRPGEKLHEVMITEDDSRQTFELPDRFVIEPAFAFWTHEPYQRLGARPVADGFRYASDTNTDWLDGARLMRLIAEAP
ncbi:UDP-N-acetylglucosamine 4,6-dehydratase (inverting) [Roseomonas genomospecies 6]|uniref:UDP-N-acetylglucosamine 4,6-dehydratase (Inverting) n=1 Tax=Roseomonas genomospecies 6 TaxID=214106 RepID=A0A9W7NFX1_9PROT|nr:UDP-N-acetylglucosamine 4,6-dehydratase (inverting) [Roseomonas genomospecies 6]KAA0675983.1 UDP-N-acetylglucosamine 4,6-dehydratase (inverting) [Roseomonas genomospecies 6]